MFTKVDELLELSVISLFTNKTSINDLQQDYVGDNHIVLFMATNAFKINSLIGLLVEDTLFLKTVYSVPTL